VIENAIIEYGGYPSQGNLYIYKSNPSIRNSIIRYSSDSGISLHLSTAEISNCTIEENAFYGVDCDGFSGILDGNLFANNGSYPIRIYPRVSPNPVVNIPNTFVSNNPDQVYFWSYIASDYTFINFGIPYLFRSDIIVSENATLTIDPGVEVNIDTGSSLNIEGRLIARGADTEKIIFTSNFPNPQPGDWNGIYFGSTATDDSVIENAIIEYGGGSTGSLRISGSNPTIRNCTVRYSGNHGIYLSGSSAFINCSNIYQNQTGIYATSSSPVILQNNITSNINWGIYNSSPTINAKYNWWGDVSGPSGEGEGFGDAVSENIAYHPWFLVLSDCSHCMGDYEPDDDVDGKNLAELVGHYGCLSNCGAFDLTGDGIVNGDDLGALALYFGRNNCVQ
jgi:parallel beta-helix repeat protein